MKRSTVKIRVSLSFKKELKKEAAERDISMIKLSNLLSRNKEFFRK